MADSVFQRALDRGAKSIEEPQNTPSGDRRAMILDPWGNAWQIATQLGPEALRALRRRVGGEDERINTDRITGRLSGPA